MQDQVFVRAPHKHFVLRGKSNDSINKHLYYQFCHYISIYVIFQLIFFKDIAIDLET